MKLNLGCGKVKLEGYQSVDFYAPDVDQRVDLFKFPWPWENESTDAIAMFHFLEHVPNLEATVDEVYRVLKPGGEWWVTVPHCGNPQSHGYYHLHRFNSVDMSTIGFTDAYWTTGLMRFTTTLMKHNFNTERKLHPFLRRLFPLLGKIASRHVEGWEFLHLPTDELEWKGIKIKTGS